MTVAQGISKTFGYKKQTGRGNPASGNGAQLLRRITAMMTLGRDTYENNEIVSHQQSTGAQHGIRRSTGTLSGLLSGGTYSDHLGSLLRKVFTATANITGASLTVAAFGTNAYKVTRSAGSFLTDGIKLGHVVRLTGMNAGNNSVNLLVIAVTATVLTVVVLNGKVLVAEGPIANANVVVPGKQTWAPLSGHTNDYYTFEEWFSDVGTSQLWPDVQLATAEVGFPSSGNVTYSETFVGLGGRTKGVAQVFTAPNPETTSSVTTAVSGAVVVIGKRQFSITSATLQINGGVAAGEAVLGSNTVSDTQKTRIMVSGSFTALYEDDALGVPFETGSTVPLILVAAEDGTDDADFVSFAMPQVKLFSDNADDGEKQIVRTYNFTAQINTAGGPALESYQTILQIHDNLAN